MSEFLDLLEEEDTTPQVAPAGGEKAAGEDELAAMFDLSKTKKKKKKAKAKDEEPAAAAASAEGQAEAAQQAQPQAYADPAGPPPYTYDDLLRRVTDLLTENNPDLGNKRRAQMKPPQLIRVGTKKTLWANFQENCRTMHRNPEHVFQFMMAELGTEGSIDGNQRLVIRGKFVAKYVESLLRKYIVEYVTCQMCRSTNTTLSRDSVSRLYFVHCQDCGSSRSVAPIRAGYHAATRADRRAARK